MKIPGKEIAEVITEDLKHQAAALTKQGKKPHLVTILVGESSAQLSFVAIKKKLAEKIGIDFTFVHLPKPPPFQEFAQKLKTFSQDPNVTGIIIQQPLPSQLQTDSIYNYIPIVKEVEGHKAKSPFLPPLGLATLTALKFAVGTNEISPDLIVDMKKDAAFFKKALKHKKVIVIGRGVTGGKPIGQALTMSKINYLSVNSQTYNPQEYYKDADVIISAAGKKTINAEDIKPGTILLTVGLRREGEKLRGDYHEEEIKDIASYYTPTPGGIGPIDVVYLYKNLIDATAMQLEKK